MAHNRARYEEALSRGHSYSWDQRWEEAVQEFEQALEEFPEEPAPYAGIGMACFELGRLDQALENYKKAARYSQGDVIYLRQVADVQERLGQLGDAGQTYMAIGEIQLRKGALDQAVDNWHRASRLAPNLLGAHQRLARYHTKQGQVRAAIREYLAIARLFQAQGDSEKALQTCRAALNLDPRNRDILTAIELIQHGEKIFEQQHEKPVEQLDGDLFAAVEGVTDSYDDEDEAWDGPGSPEAASPVQNARRMALEQLAEQLFAEEDEAQDDRDGLVLGKMERDALISQALDYQTRGRTNEAISAYRKAIEAGVNNAAAHFNLGLLYQDKLRFEDAIQEFEISVQDQEYRLGSHFALGESYRARGQIDKAVEHFVTVLKIVDLDTVQHEQADRLIELYENLADSLVTRGEPEKATEFSNALVEFLSHKGWEDKVKDARARLNALSGDRMMILGDILTAGSAKVLESLYLSQEYARRQMLDTAVEEVFRAIAYSPDYLPAHIQLGELLARQERMQAALSKFTAVGDTFRVRGDINNAISMYERVVELSPLDVSIRARVIDMLKRHGHIDKSLEHYLALGEACYQLAQVDKARETYQEALRLAPRGSADKKWRATILRRIADIDMQRFDWKRALSAYTELRREDPTDERTAMTLVDLYFKLGQPAYALRELDQYLKQLVSSGRGAKVTGILKDMVRRHPAETGLVQRLVRLYLAQKRQDQAIQLLDDLGEALLEKGQTQEAIAAIEQIIQLDPPNVASYRQLLKQMRSL
ncbi:MAG TPA: tetratricopeptide repeat protein [Candidatus Sulfomarinibacteraceae bacterium]|nr:tetratricopeptide repeat protein [Candidatus Sulfomarinibacteraceae bacterium]